MSHLSALKSVVNLHGVAELLGFKPAALSYILYKKHPSTKYTQFEIPKRQGGKRQINAPSSDLKLLQRRLADVLQNCVQEISSANARPDRIAHGFKRGRSILTNAREHRGRRYVFNVDLKDYFASINFGRVRGFFILDQQFALPPNVATILAQIACFQDGLPQGSPCSPVISNLIGHILDIHLVRLASRTGCSYTRYADDLTFSTNKKTFPPGIARPSAEPHTWVPGLELERLVARSGFTINPEKVRMQYRDSRQEVTGLVVNRKVNVRREYRHTVRAMVHRLLTTGSFDFVHATVDPNGTRTQIRTAGNVNELRGMLGFIDGVDLYNRALSPKGAKRSSALSTKELLYLRFLLFTEFHAAQAPVIICEGKSDTVYLVHAIRGLATKYPQLATVAPNGDITLKVRVYKYPGTSTGRILGIGGGADDLAKLIWTYREQHKRFKAAGQQHPVILLIDNDSGAEKTYKAVAQITKVKPTGKEPFLHVFANLYVVATPWKPGGPQDSKIEDLFDPSVTATIIGGKSFDPSSEFDTASHYGKIVLAHKVVKPLANTIDFGGFGALLSNVVDAIDTHTKMYPAPGT